MKLPQITAPRRASLPRQGMGPAVQQQQAKLGVFDAITKLGQNLAQQKIEADAAEANSGYGDFVSQVERELAPVRSLTPQELRDAGLSEADGLALKDAGGADRDYLLRHEWYPQLLDKRMREASEQYGNKITHAPTREAWMADQATRRQDYVGRLTQRAAADAAKFEMEDAEARNAADAQLGNWQSIQDRVNTRAGYRDDPVRKQYWEQRAATGMYTQELDMVYETGSSQQIKERQEVLRNALTDEKARESIPLSEPQIVQELNRGDTAYRQTRKREVATYEQPYTEAIRTGDVALMQSQLKSLQSKDYGSRPADILDENENIALQNQLRAGINASTSKVTAQINSEVARLERGMDTFIQQANGGLVDPAEYPRAIEEAERAQALYDLKSGDTPKSFIDKRDAVYEAMQRQETRRVNMTLPAYEQQQRLNESATATSREGITEHERRQEDYDLFIEEYDADPYSLVRKLNLDMGEGSQPLPPFGTPEYYEALPLRDESMRAVEGHYGRNASMLTPAEVDDLEDAFATQDADTLISSMGATVMALGPEGAKQYYEDAGAAESYVPMAAGLMVTEGRMDVARWIISGANMLDGQEGEPRFELPDDITVRAKIREDLQGSYGTGYMRERMGAAIRAAYAHLVASSGDVNADSYDPRLYEQAREAVLGGGMVTIDGVKQEPPAPGISQERVDQWYAGITHQSNVERLPDLDPMENIDKGMVSRGLRSGRYVLVHSGKRGVWNIMDKQGTAQGERKGAILRDATGQNPAEIVWQEDISAPPPRTRRTIQRGR